MPKVINPTYQSRKAFVLVDDKGFYFSHWADGVEGIYSNPVSTNLLAEAKLFKSVRLAELYKKLSPGIYAIRKVKLGGLV